MLLAATLWPTIGINVDTRALLHHRAPNQNETVGVGALESSVDILLRFDREISKEKKQAAEDQRVHEAECNLTRTDSLETIADAKRAEGDLIGPGDYIEVIGSLDLAIANTRSHYLNSTFWVKESSIAYASTATELEKANHQLEGMLSRHDGVSDALSSLVKRVERHKKAHKTNKKAQPTWNTGTSISFLQESVLHMQQQKLNDKHVSSLVLSLLEINKENNNGEWHDQVLRLTSSIATAVAESKMIRTKPLRSKVDGLKKVLQLEGIEMKRAMEAKSISSDALVTAKRSKSILEARSVESAAKRAHFLQVTKQARLKLAGIDKVCSNEYNKWHEVDEANHESLETIAEFISVLTSRKTEQENKLEQAVAMMSQ